MAGPAWSQEDAPPPSLPVAKVLVEGNQYIRTETILYTVRLQAGDPFNLQRIREDIKRLYQTEFFEDIQVDAKEAGGGITVTFIVKEKPVIERIDLIGNKAISEDTLQEKLTLKENQLFRQSQIQESIEAIKNAYLEDGYNFAEVNIEHETVKPGSILVTVRISENAKIKIKKIVFEGNQVFSDRKLRKALKETKQKWLFGFLTGAGKYDPDKFKADMELLDDFYKDHGYLKFKAGEPKVEVIKTIKKKKKSKSYLQITIPVDEGPQYKIGALDITGNVLYDQKSLFEALRSVKEEGLFAKTIFSGSRPKVESGEVFSQAGVRAGIEQMTSLYSSKGYIYTNIFPQKVLHDANLTVDVTFQVSEGQQAFLRKLEFRGNIRTRDKVLRREMFLDEGDAFNTDAFRESMQKIFYLGYIENLEPDVKPDPDDLSQVDATVSLSDEHRTEIQVSGGFSTLDQFIFSASVAEFNFWGYGQELRVSGTLGKFRQIYSLSFTDPYVMDSRFFGSGDVYRTETDYTLYVRRVTGGDLTSGFNLTPYVFTRLGYGIRVENIFELPQALKLKDKDPETYGEPTSQEQAILDAQGKSLTSSLTWSLVYDKRDNRRDPTKGSRLALTAEYAGGFVGGDNHFYKWELEGVHFTPFWRNLVLAFHGQIQFADSYFGHNLPVFEYYRLGGERSIRGTEFNSFGPLDRNLETLGGNKALQFNTELIIPLAGPLKTVLFFDMGDVYGKDEIYDPMTMRKTVGVELRFFIPSFWVPIRFIWGYNLDSYSYEKQSDFQFAIGNIF